MVEGLKKAISILQLWNNPVRDKIPVEKKSNPLLYTVPQGHNFISGFSIFMIF
jgi:hypothetical protein